MIAYMIAYSMVKYITADLYIAALSAALSLTMLDLIRAAHLVGVRRTLEMTCLLHN